MIRNFSKFIAPLLVLALVFCLASGVSARIADTQRFAVVDSDGNDVDVDATAFSYYDAYYLIGEGLIPNTDYDIVFGNVTANVVTDANGFFIQKTYVSDAAQDETDDRTFTLRLDGETEDLATIGPITYTPTISLGKSSYYVTETFEDSTTDGNDSYVITLKVHGFNSEAEISGTIGDEDLEFAIGDQNDNTTVDDEITLNESGAFDDPVAFQVPEMPGGDYTVTITDGTNEATASFTVNPMIFFSYVKRTQGTADNDIDVSADDAGNDFGDQDGYYSSTCDLTSLSMDIGDGNEDTGALNLGAAGRAGCIPVYGNPDGSMYDDETSTLDDSFKWIVISGTGFAAETEIDNFSIADESIDVADAANDENWVVETSSKGSFGISQSSANLPIVIDTGIDLGEDLGLGVQDVAVEDNTFEDSIIITGTGTTSYPTIESDSTSGEVGDDVTIIFRDFNDPVSSSAIQDDSTAISVMLYPNGSSTEFASVTDSLLGIDSISGLGSNGLVSSTNDLPFLGGSFEIEIPDVRNKFSSGSPLPISIKLVAGKVGNGTDGNDDNVAYGIDEVAYTVNPSLSFHSYTSAPAIKRVSTTGSYSDNDLDDFSLQNGDVLFVDVHGFAATSTKGEDVEVTLNGISYSYYTCDANDSSGYDSGTFGDQLYTSPYDGTLANTNNVTTDANDVACLAIELGKPTSTVKASYQLPAGTYDLTVSSDTEGSSVTESVTIEEGSSSVTVEKFTYSVYNAPSSASTSGTNAVKVTNTTDTSVINGAEILLESLTDTGDLKASTQYLLVLDNKYDGLNVQVLGSFTSSTYGLVPSQTTLTLPKTLLPGSHAMFIAEDVDEDGVFTLGTDTVTGVSFTSLEVYPHAKADTIRAGAGDPVTVYLYGLNPSNYPLGDDTTEEIEYKLVYDADNNATQAAGYTGSDEILAQNILGNLDGQEELSIILPQVEGDTTSDMGLVEQLDESAPIRSIGDAAGDNDGVVGYNVERKITLTLSSYVGDPGDAIYLYGDGLDTLESYTLTFGGAGAEDSGNIPSGYPITDFQTDEDGEIPDDTFFIVPQANNSAYGVVVTPTPAANVIDLLKTDGNDSVLDASDKLLFTVGGSQATLDSAASTGPTTVQVNFSESLNEVDAEDTSNYAISTEGGESLSISSADADGSVVTLTTDQQSEEEYTLTVSNVLDVYGTQVSGTATFTGTATGLVFDPPTLPTLDVNGTETFTVTLEGYDGDFTAISSDENIATVELQVDDTRTTSATFVVTGVAVGTATITVTDDPDNEYSGTLAVTVSDGSTTEPIDTPDQVISNGGNGDDYSTDSSTAKFYPGTVVNGELTGNIQWTVNIPEYNSPVSVWILIFGPGEEGVTFGNANLINSAGEFISDSAGYPKYAENQTGPFQATIGDEFDPCDTELAGEDLANVRYGVYFLVVDHSIIESYGGTDADQLLYILSGQNAELGYLWFNAVCSE